MDSNFIQSVIWVTFWLVIWGFFFWKIGGYIEEKEKNRRR